MTEQIVCADIGGTNARFALAELSDNGSVQSLTSPLTLPVKNYPSLQSAWETFAEHIGKPLPKKAGLALPCPIQGDILRMANSPWVIIPKNLPEELGISSFRLINDFEAIAYATNALETSCLPHLCGPDHDLPEEGTIIVIGPGTGLGTASILRRNGKSFISSAEGGHIAFPPLDMFEDQLLQTLRSIHGRVSVERIISGPGIIPIHALIRKNKNLPEQILTDKELWTQALSGSSEETIEAMDRFCMMLGGFSGDMALAHGASGVVIAGGLGKRLESVLPHSSFEKRFSEKGRFEPLMKTITVKMISYPEPGLFGAATALGLQLQNRT